MWFKAVRDFTQVLGHESPFSSTEAARPYMRTSRLGALSVAVAGLTTLLSPFWPGVLSDVVTPHPLWTARSPSRTTLGILLWVPSQSL